MGGFLLETARVVLPFIESFPVLLVFVLMLGCSRALCADVVINEVYYDHPGNDDGYEFVELYNSTGVSVDISGWRIEFIDGAGHEVHLLWEADQGIAIDPYGFILVGGCRYTAEGAFPILRSIENGPDAVRLCSPRGVADVVGYGDLTDRSLFESTPAEDVPAGYSLSRRPDGLDRDDNSLDFVPALPTPGIKNFHEHDLKLSAKENIVVCRDKDITIVYYIENCGLSELNGEIVLGARLLGYAEIPLAQVSKSVGIVLEPGTLDSTRLSLPAAYGEMERFAIVEADIDAPFDGNHSNDSCISVVSFLPGNIVVSEIMYRPDTGGCEWIELYNRGPGVVDLHGWSFCDKGGARRLITHGNLQIGQGEYLLLVQNSLVFTRANPSCGCMVVEPAGGWAFLNDRSDGGFADVITIYDVEGRVRERVSYGEILSDERGRSIERVSVDACSAGDAGIWQRCVDPRRSTPCERNSVDTKILSGFGDVSISPNPFNPMNGKLMITVSCLDGREGVRVKIFDLNGIEKTELFSDACNGGVYTCLWDGKTGGGEPVPDGLYICAIEFFASGGGVRWVVKRGIAVYSY